MTNPWATRQTLPHHKTASKMGTHNTVESGPRLYWFPQLSPIVSFNKYFEFSTFLWIERTSYMPRVFPSVLCPLSLLRVPLGKITYTYNIHKKPRIIWRSITWGYGKVRRKAKGNNLMVLTGNSLVLVPMDASLTLRTKSRNHKGNDFL